MGLDRQGSNVKDFATIRRIQEITTTMLAGPPEEHGRPDWPTQEAELTAAIAAWSSPAAVDATWADQPCGSQRITEVVEGNAARVQWCSRTVGPCPFPGTKEEPKSERKCADSPGVRLYVHYEDEMVGAARTALRRLARRAALAADAGQGYVEVSVTIAADLYVAIAAITACVGDEDPEKSGLED